MRKAWPQAAHAPVRAGRLWRSVRTARCRGRNGLVRGHGVDARSHQRLRGVASEARTKARRRPRSLPARDGIQASLNQVGLARAKHQAGAVMASLQKWSKSGPIIGRSPRPERCRGPDLPRGQPVRPGRSWRRRRACPRPRWSPRPVPRNVHLPWRWPRTPARRRTPMPVRTIARRHAIGLRDDCETAGRPPGGRSFPAVPGSAGSPAVRPACPRPYASRPVQHRPGRA